MHQAGALIAGLLVAAATAHAEGPAFLVKDINTTQAVREPYEDEPSSNPHDFAVLDGIVYFAAGDVYDGYGEGPNGVELWRSDGTPAGTFLVKDIWPGPGGSAPTDLQVRDGALYFLANDSERGVGLWRSDGTLAGTDLLAATGQPNLRAWSLTRVGSQWLFTVSSQFGSDLWAIDAGGAAQSIAHLSSIPYDQHGSLRIVGGETAAYLIASHDQYGAEVWRTDGSATGTRVVGDVRPGSISSLPGSLVVVGDTAFFAADDGVHGRELWRADAQGATLVADLLPDFYGGDPIGLMPIADEFLFVANGPGAAPGERVVQLWRSDGTEAGTRAIATLPGFTQDGRAFKPFAGALFFGAGPQLWRTDGTAAGTWPVRDFLVHSGYYSSVSVAGAADHLLLLVDDESSDEIVLWRSDGTTEGTVPLRGFGWITDRFFGSLEGATAGNGRFVFPADDGTGVEPWSSDGTAEGTVQLAEINPGATDISDVDGIYPVLADMDGTLVFLAQDRQPDSAIWKSDGTEAGTQRVAPVEESYFTTWLAPVGERLYFTSYSPEAGNELWEIPSLGAPARLLADVFPGPNGSRAGPLGILDGELILSADDGVHGLEPWAPYEQGVLADIEPGLRESYPHHPVRLNGFIYFLAGTDLWRTDGRAAGTTRVATVNAEWSWAMIAGEDRLALLTQRPDEDFDLWFSDGRPAGTVHVATVPLPTSRGPRAWPIPLAFVGSTLLFAADDDAHGVELWRSDGTAAGTGLLADINPGPDSSSPGAAASAGSAVLFFAADAEHGREPWTSDGTAAGTALLADLQPGPLSSRDWTDEPAAVIGDAFVFGASDGARGLELWRSDGTAAGTALLQDIVPGVRSSSPRHFTVSGNHLFFTANDNQHGRELWAVPLRDLGCAGDCPAPTPTPRETPRPVWTPGPPLPTLTVTATPTPRSTPHCGDAGDGLDCVQLIVGSAVGAAGEQVEIGVTLRTGGLPVAAVQIDLLTGNGLHLAADDDCRVNPDIGKIGAFAFQQDGALRAIILSLLDTEPIASGSVLFTCTYRIPDDALPGGNFAVSCRNAAGSTPEGEEIGPANASGYGAGELVCTDGAVRVAGLDASPTPTGTPRRSDGGNALRALGGGGCQIDRGAPSPGALLLLLPLVLSLYLRSPGLRAGWRAKRAQTRCHTP